MYGARQCAVYTPMTYERTAFAFIFQSHIPVFKMHKLCVCFFFFLTFRVHFAFVFCLIFISDKQKKKTKQKTYKLIALYFCIM